MAMTSNSKLNQVMTNEQFIQVVDAILAGKYSWACVLILRFAGYNPLHYIPYRTYNRLMKENLSVCNQRWHQNDRHSQDTLGKKLDSQHSSDPITDLDYLEPLHDQYSKVRGGECSYFTSYYIPYCIESFEHSD
jgi:hypothetical protein